jgi:hypothetical protein
MKCMSCILTALFITFNLYSQNCGKLDNTSFFKTIKFGEQIPESFIACSRGPKFESQYFTEFHFEYDSLSNFCKINYRSYFNFFSVPFKSSKIITNKKGQIVTVQLYSFFDDKSSADSMISKPPGSFTKIYNKLTSLYGSPTSVQKPTSLDSLLVKEIGLRSYYEWRCMNMAVELRICYGSTNKGLDLFHVILTNMKYEPLPEVERIKE